MFRVPEKRPPKAVSTAFTFLIFVPLAIMLIVVSFLCLYTSFFMDNFTSVYTCFSGELLSFVFSCANLMSLDEGKSNSRLHKLGEGRVEEYWHELLTQGFLRLFGSSSVFSHDWSMVSKGNYKYSHSLVLSTQTIIRKDCNQSPFSFKFSEGSARLQPRAWSFSCIVRFARQTNKKKIHLFVKKTKYLHSTVNSL